MSLCARCRTRDADSGKFATESWESRCRYCVLATAGAAERLREEYPEEVGAHA